MGRPLLLIEAASCYRGDLEDRRTELLAVALNEHVAFRDRVLSRLGVDELYDRAEVATQQTYRIDHDRLRVRIDLVLRLFDQDEQLQAVVFLEHKFNPEKSGRGRWFEEDQAPKQLAALVQEAASAKQRLAAIVSDCDLGNSLRRVPIEYGDPLGWREVAEIAGLAGGPTGWQELAREPTAPASQRILLEVWAYLKGDAVGALEDEDLVALGRTVQAWDRVQALLERVSEMLGFHDEVGDDWETEAETSIVYIVGEPPADSWVAERTEGQLYVAITDGLWNDEASLREPQLYAGWGIAATRDERTTAASSGWPPAVERAGLLSVFDRDGLYVFGRCELRQLVRLGATLTEQAEQSVEWIQTALGKALGAPVPPT